MQVHPYRSSHIQHQSLHPFPNLALFILADFVVCFILGLRASIIVPKLHVLTLLSIFQRYKLSAHSFTPIIPDIEEFEVELCQYLEERAFLKRQSYLQNPGTHAPEIPRSVSWVGSLLAVLASGAQYTQNSSQERQAKSRLYGEFENPRAELDFPFVCQIGADDCPQLGTPSNVLEWLIFWFDHPCCVSRHY